MRCHHKINEFKQLKGDFTSTVSFASLSTLFFFLSALTMFSFLNFQVQYYMSNVLASYCHCIMFYC